MVSPRQNLKQDKPLFTFTAGIQYVKQSLPPVLVCFLVSLPFPCHSIFSSHALSCKHVLPFTF